jgi:hypothetical protein
MCCALTLGMRSSRVAPAGTAADVCAASGGPDACAPSGETAGTTASAAAATRTEAWDMVGPVEERRATDVAPRAGATNGMKCYAADPGSAVGATGSCALARRAGPLRVAVLRAA